MIPELGQFALIVALSRHAGMAWDAVLGAEPARSYKPLAEVYLRSVALLGVRPGEQASPGAGAVSAEEVPSSLGPWLVMMLLILVVVESLVGNWHLRIRRGVAA